ncbi:GFA family protein [Rhodovibrionaceae bacterium A322]
MPDAQSVQRIQQRDAGCCKPPCPCATGQGLPLPLRLLIDPDLCNTSRATVVKEMTEREHMEKHEGGCLCGRIRYATLGQPSRVTVCHCRFCQKATGSAYMVEPIFDAASFSILSGAPKVFDQQSVGSGKTVHVNFCPDCGTKLWLSFERFPDAIGIYAGTFDDPCWFPIESANSKHIFLEAARPDTIVPSGLPTFSEHATTNDGAPQEATVFEAFHQIGAK